MSAPENTGLFVAGVVLSICISSCNSLGMGLQKRVHKALSVAGDKAKKYYQDPKWVLGLVFMSFASVGSLGNYALLGQSRASAMASITIVTNAVMARYMLHEYLGWFDVLVILLIMAGVTIAVVYGSTAGAPRSSLDDIIILLNRDTVYIAIGLIAVYAVAAETFVHSAEKRGRSGKKTHLEAKMECFVRAFTAGLFSGSTGFFAKGVVTSIESMVASKSPSDMTKWQFWLFLLGLPASIVLQLRGLNSGLKYFDATDVVPIYQSSIIFWGVTSGWVFYNENSTLSDTAEAMFATGCLISVVGILMLLAKKKPLTQGEVPPALVNDVKLAALHGQQAAYQELLAEDVEGGPEAKLFAPIAPYAGAPALTPAPAVFPSLGPGMVLPTGGKGLNSKPSFSLGGRTSGGAGKGGASEVTPLTSPRHAGMGMTDQAPGLGAQGGGFTGRALGLIRSDTVRDVSQRLLMPAENTTADPLGTELVRRRADTATGVALLNALDVFVPTLGRAVSGEGGSAAGGTGGGAAPAGASASTVIERTGTGGGSAAGSRKGSTDVDAAGAGPSGGSVLDSIARGITRMASVRGRSGSLSVDRTHSGPTGAAGAVAVHVAGAAAAPRSGSPAVAASSSGSASTGPADQL